MQEKMIGWPETSYEQPCVWLVRYSTYSNAKKRPPEIHKFARVFVSYSDAKAFIDNPGDGLYVTDQEPQERRPDQPIPIR